MDMMMGSLFQLRRTPPLLPPPPPQPPPAPPLSLPRHSGSIHRWKYDAFVSYRATEMTGGRSSSRCSCTPSATRGLPLSCSPPTTPTRDGAWANCHEENKPDHVVEPVFFRVSPSDVCPQTGEHVRERIREGCSEEPGQAGLVEGCSRQSCQLGGVEFEE
ncbi:hypothetical protein CRG98_040326 [Punica granatum]|uniref:Uncharacterized protein n=1 Tax=Punica granatum TaxID=22663 RepID=A0A2I0I6G9_PUNGR|nr:hypothetical protein CRG98_040326 [Punica granatum]